MEVLKRFVGKIRHTASAAKLKIKAGASDAGSKIKAGAFAVGSKTKTSVSAMCSGIKTALSSAKAFTVVKAKAGISALKANKKYRRTAVLTLAFIVLVSSSSLIPIGYAVSVDGVQIGYVASKEEAQALIDSVETQASEILGSEYSLEDKVKVASVIGKEEVAENDELEKIMMDSVEEIKELYGVYLDGELIAAVENEDTVDEVKAEIIEQYGNENNINTTLVQSVEAEYEYVAASREVSEEELYEMLDPANDSSPYSLDIRATYMVEETEAIPFETVSTGSSSMYKGQSKVVTEGVNGEILNSYYAVSINGEEIGRALVETTVTAEAVNREVVYGTKEKPSTVSTGSYLFPTNGQISSYFGYRNVSVGSSYHQGLDIWGSYGQAIWAADGGTVTFSGWNNGGYGYLVVITHDNGEQTYYAHCSSVAVSQGERVFKGQTIAYMGATGTASGVHVHFEVRVGGQPVDPLTCLQ